MWNEIYNFKVKLITKEILDSKNLEFKLNGKMDENALKTKFKLINKMNINFYCIIVYISRQKITTNY